MTHHILEARPLMRAKRLPPLAYPERKRAHKRLLLGLRAKA